MKQALVVGLSIALSVGATAAVEESRMRHIMQEKDAQAVLSDWQAAHVLIRFAGGHPYQFFDATNPFEANWTKRITSLLVVSRNDGRILEQSPLYRSLGLPTPPAASSDPRVWRIGNRYIFCTGPLRDEDGKLYQLTVGKRL
jgi:hypothetical protein